MFHKKILFLLLCLITTTIAHAGSLNQVVQLENGIVSALPPFPNPANDPMRERDRERIEALNKIDLLTKTVAEDTIRRDEWKNPYLPIRTTIARSAAEH